MAETNTDEVYTILLRPRSSTTANTTVFAVVEFWPFWPFADAFFCDLSKLKYRFITVCIRIQIILVPEVYTMAGLGDPDEDPSRCLKRRSEFWPKHWPPAGFQRFKHFPRFRRSKSAPCSTLNIRSTWRKTTQHLRIEPHIQARWSKTNKFPPNPANCYLRRR